MKDFLSKISSPIESDIQLFQNEMVRSLESSVGLINRVVRYLIHKKGKQLRPRLTLLSARLCGEPVKLTYKAAALVEILHVATLIHDDVVDDADTRRGIPTIKRIWKNKIAILVGDFMFSRALTNIIQLRDFEALDVMSSVSSRLSEGEILQIEKAIKKDMSEEVYLKMISDKTASLFSAACVLGAITVTDDEEQRNAIRNFGEKFGIAFQIKDDLFDILGTLDSVGKPTGFDVKKNMLTLPLIHMFKQLETGDRKDIQRKLKHHARRRELKQIKQLIDEYNGIEYSVAKMEEISDEARTCLEIFPETPVKASLIKILDYNIKRQF
mgnify:CR=1 FL=1